MIVINNYQIQLKSNCIITVFYHLFVCFSLQILSMGGNLLSEVPETVGNLSHLQGLILCDNLIENLPTSIARLKNLKSLLLHKNRLKHLPRDIISLRNLVEVSKQLILKYWYLIHLFVFFVNKLSLRENPLVVRFVQDISLNPSSLLELAARTVRSTQMPYGPADIPRTLSDYLKTAHCCVNPKCSGNNLIYISIQNYNKP